MSQQNPYESERQAAWVRHVLLEANRVTRFSISPDSLGEFMSELRHAKDSVKATLTKALAALSEESTLAPGAKGAEGE